MIKIIPNKKDIGAEIECDLKKISNQDLVDSTISENRDLYLKAYINWKKNLEILIKNK